MNCQSRIDGCCRNGFKPSPVPIIPILKNKYFFNYEVWLMNNSKLGLGNYIMRNGKIVQWAKTRKIFQSQRCVWVIAWLHQRLKSTFFEIFFSLQVSFGTLHSKNFKKTLILVFEVIMQSTKHTFEIGTFFVF